MKQVLKWMEETHIIQGINRECVYDSPRGTYYLVSLGFSDLVKKIEGYDKEYLINNLDPVELEWLNFMEEHELIMWLPEVTHSLFPKIGSGFETPNYISNGIIEFGDSFESALLLLDNLLCRHIEIIIYSIDDLKDVFENHFQDSCFQSVDLDIRDLDYDLNVLIDLIEGNSIIGNVVVPKLDEAIHLNDGSTRIIGRREQIVYKPMLISNEAVFFESEKHNVFLNKKLYINKKGLISLYKGLSVFGNIRDVTLDEVKLFIQSEEVVETWSTPKDKIDVCNVCEFRRMCLDNRRPVKRENIEDSYYMESDCAYNPYISKWKDDDGYMSLEESGVTCNQDTLSIDYKRLNQVRNQIWQ